jgi:hypothetical protein
MSREEISGEEESEKTSWSLKTSFWKKIYPKNSKTVIKKCVAFPQLNFL